MKWCVLGELPNTPMMRYAVLDHGCVVDVTVSVPEGEEVLRPAVLRWRRVESDVAVRTRVDYQQFSISKHNGEQPRRPTWKRSGRTAAPQ